MKPTSLLCALCLPLALGAATTAFAAKGYYTWKDANGITHYATTPPVNADSEARRFGPERDIHTQYVKPDAAPATDTAKSGATSAADEEAQPAAATETAAAPELYKKDPQRCAHARENLATLGSQRPIRATDAEGNKRLLTPEDREQQLQIARETIDIHC